jgi:peptidoglycan lytic transglycosylase G
MRLRWLVLAFAAIVAALGWAVLTPTAAVRQGPLVVTIPPHGGLLGVADRLAEAGVIHSRAAFVTLTVLRGVPRSLKAGEYEIARDANAWDIVSLLESGRVRQHAILHPEGATVAELARALEAERLADADAIARVASDRKFLDAQGIEAPSVEGYLFPDTYQFVRGMTPDEILGRMAQRMRSKLTPEIRARAAEQGLTIHQVLTLASIIEREAVDKEEQRLISGVFWNRLKAGMPLQADPTVQYAVAKERRALSRTDLAVDHPYNTYTRPGLPPGPIASPGLEAIQAAVDPAPVKYLYFVKRDDRRHYFSTTVEEHNAAVTRYRLSRR